ncbi:hypothetical protein VTI74DRAFT_11152 [Chaetomium olivicolor]
MARYGVEFADDIGDPRRLRPLAHIRSPHEVQRSRQNRSRSRDRDRAGRNQAPSDRDRIINDAVETRIVNAIIDNNPDNPININFNYGPVHIHHTCSCPGGGHPHTCLSRPSPVGSSPRPNRHSITFRPPPPPSPADRRRPPPPPPPELPRPLRSALRVRAPSPAPGRVRSPVIVPSSDSSDFDDGGRTVARVRYRDTVRNPAMDRTTVTVGGAGAGAGGASVTVGICEGCFTRKRLVFDDYYCAECEAFAVADGARSQGGGERYCVGERVSSVWNGVRYLPGRGEDVARREERERQRWVEAEMEARERERERELRDRDLREDLIRERMRARVREEREREVREREREREPRVVRERYSGRERRLYPSGGDRVYFSDSDGDTSSW